MKYNKLFLGGILLAMMLFLAACSSQPTQPQKEINTTTNLGTEQNTANVSVPVVTPPAPQVNTTPKPVETAPVVVPTTPKVSVDTIYLKGSRFGQSRYLFNQIYVNITSDMPLNWEKLKIYVGNQYYNGTLNYSSNVSCTNVVNLLANRNKQFAASGSSTSAELCFSPARDMNTPETVSFVGTYDGSVVINDVIKIPSGIVTTAVRIR